MVEVPIGGTIRNTVEWNAIVGGMPVKNFALICFYGTNTDDTIGGFQTGSTGPAPVVKLITGSATGIQTYLDQVIADYANEGTYDGLTIIGDGDDPDFPYAPLEEFYDWRFDNGVLTVLPTLGAEVVNTIFTTV